MDSRRQKTSQFLVELACALRGDRRGHRAEFLVLREDVAQALQNGYSIRAVHSQLRDSGRVSFGYDTFRRYVLRHIPDAQRGPFNLDQPAPERGGGQPSAQRSVDHRRTPSPQPSSDATKGKFYKERDPLDPPDMTKYP